MAVTDDIKWDGVTFPTCRAKAHDPPVAEALHTASPRTSTRSRTRCSVTRCGTSTSSTARPMHPDVRVADLRLRARLQSGDSRRRGQLRLLRTVQLQYLAAATSPAIKWTLEYRSENPGIHPGDMFLFNDPWVGATHQSDVGIVAPVFVGDELFCWVGNTLHQWDIGGTAPGGFNPIAQDVFWEVTVLSRRSSSSRAASCAATSRSTTRAPRGCAICRLDLRARSPAANRPRPDQPADRPLRRRPVKATMRKLQDDSEAAFVRRLETIPDGQWTEEGWMEMKAARRPRPVPQPASR